jgi:hypothetical protein
MNGAIDGNDPSRSIQIYNSGRYSSDKKHSKDLCHRENKIGIHLVTSLKNNSKAGQQRRVEDGTDL